MSSYRRFLLLAFLALPTLAVAQKKALTQADWDIWKSISSPTITNDGRWAVYSLAPLVGDGELVIRSTTGATEHRVPRGYLGRPNNVPGGLRPRAGANPEADPSGPSIAPAQVTADSRHALALVYPTRAEFLRAGTGRRAAAVTGRSDLAIVRLEDGNVTMIERVRSFRLPRNNGDWVAYVPADTATQRPAPRDENADDDNARRRRYGNPLVLRNLATGEEQRIEDVADYSFDDAGKLLAYLVVSRTAERNGAFVRDLSNGTTKTLLAGEGDYRQIAVDRAGTQVAFVTNRDDFSGDRAYALYHATIRDNGARLAAAPASLNGLEISENANVSFTRNGTAVLFGIAPERLEALPADSLRDKAVFDLWHYQDPDLQPAQRLREARDRNRSFQTIYHVSSRRIVRLANDSIPSVSVTDDGRWALANSGERYSVEAMWGEDGTDVYLIDAMTGAIRLLREKITGNAQLSTSGRYVIYYHDGQYYSYGIASGRTVELTRPIAGVSFARETHSTPSDPPGWGVAGWTHDDRSVLLYDRYDLWEVDPAGGRRAVMVTDSLGRRTQTVLRIALGEDDDDEQDADERGIDPDQPLLLRAVNDETKAQGFMRDWLGRTRAPEAIVQADAAFGSLRKARDAEQYLLTKGTFTTFPDLHTGSSLASLTRISDANPQQREYNWGSVELVRWANSDGIPLKGLLYKPENFDSTRQYPMVVYHYELRSQNLHTYYPPNGRNVVNPTHYVSNGYLVFEPDIHYEEGYPGPSALKSIVPGVTMLLARGYVDPKGVGIQGQSWGGYQGLYMVTQTKIFSAAMLGAPVVNMTSAYGGIRWGSGLARAFQYETGQSRIGGSIWETPLRYIENSPLFWLDKVETPVFMMHNDMDDAVPWYQGIEAFVALRRLGKEVYLINYNNDVHNPQSRANQKDMAMRMQQFFDHHLRGMPAPEWMKKGVPYLAKGRDQVAIEAMPVQAGSEAPQVPQSRQR